MDNELLHMDEASRNIRLRDTLIGMGLFVVPVYSDTDTETIDHLIVSASLPKQLSGTADAATGRPVPEPVSSAQVEVSVTPTVRGRDNVVDLPTKR